MRLHVGDSKVSIIAATLASLDAEELGGAATAAKLKVEPPDTWPPEHHDANTREWMRGMIRQHPGEPGYGSWYIIGDGRLVGTAGYKGPPDDDGRVEIGYSVIESQQRKGYGSGAVRLLVEQAFRDPRVRSVAAETLPELIASQVLLERCGFKLVSRTTDDEMGQILRYELARP